MNPVWRARLRRVPGLLPVWRAVRIAIDADHRAIERLRRTRPDSLLQPWPTTSQDRYPVLFDAIADALSARMVPRVLCFGCASGEEVRALRARLPHAEIVGVDINPRAIARARRSDRVPGVHYIVNDSPPPGQRFDAVLAMAVFRHGALGERPASCADILPFRRFEEGLARLDAALRPGGLLAIGNAHFRLADTRLSASYEAILRLRDDPPPQNILYGRDDRLIEGACEDAVLFRKLG